MTQALATTTQGDYAVMERVVALGDLAKLTPAERMAYYMRVCESVGLNPFTRPFEYISLSGKLTLYARKDATEQLREIHKISIKILGRERTEDVYVVHARATKPSGREDESIGAVAIAGLKGESMANAMMKAETKAKRRVTLSICGLGWLDESEIADIPGAKKVQVDFETGEIVDRSSPAERLAPPRVVKTKAAEFEEQFRTSTTPAAWNAACAAAKAAQAAKDITDAEAKHLRAVATKYRPAPTPVPAPVVETPHDADGVVEEGPTEAA